MATPVTLRDVLDRLDAWYPPGTAEGWDAVGLVLGDPEARVRKVMFAVDPTIEVAREAAEWGADLLVVHHPLHLKPVHGFARTTPKGRTLGVLADAGCALLTAHTNADKATDGVSAAIAEALGLSDVGPLVPSGAGSALDKLTTFVPADAAAVVRAALAEAGAGRLGDYDSASFSVTGEGRFRPLEGADPTIGEIGRLETVEEVRIEVVLPRSRRSAVVAALLRAHPYEEPAWDLVELVDPTPAPTGIGRIGSVPATTLREFAARTAAALPPTAHGVRVAGDPDRPVRRVALCGGAGDSLLDTVLRTDADVYVTSDLRHHVALEFLEKDHAALIDVAHFAAEWTWLPQVEKRLKADLGDTVDTRISTLVTDPWSFRA